MPKRLHLEKHFSTQELEDRYRQTRDPVERTHYQIVWLLSQGKLTREVADATGYSPEWIREVSRRYNEGAAEGLGDRRHRNPGAVPLLSPEQQEELAEALSEPPEDGGLWNSRKVALWIEKKTARQGVRAQRGWEYLRRLGYTPQVPRPSNAGADPEEQEAFKKGSPKG
jgi:transposase